MRTDISIDVIKTDIANTEKELDAYDKIQAGFLTLSQLPENDGYVANHYQMKHYKYLQLKEECDKFLTKLKSLLGEREVAE
jgi:hypothetical protein